MASKHINIKFVNREEEMDKKYEVLIGETIVGTKMTLDIAFCLIRGYALDKFYSGDILDVRIKELVPTEIVRSND